MTISTCVDLLYGKEIRQLCIQIFTPIFLETPKKIEQEFEQEFVRLTVEVLGEYEVIKIIKVGIRVYGRKIWEIYFKNKFFADENYNYADHVVSPAALAFALAEGEFTRQEIRKIRFGHSGTPEAYVQKYYDWEYPWKILRGVVEWKLPPSIPTLVTAMCCCP